MKRFFKKLIITVGVLTFVGVIYSFIISDTQNGLSLPVAYGGDLVSSQGEVSPLLGRSDNQVIADIAFLNTLESLKQLQIDESFFRSQLFTRLNDNTVLIDPIPAGRENPFAPIDVKNIPKNSDLPSVVTEKATQITKDTAVLNGFVNLATGVKDIRFEYGLTESFGSETVTLKQSLVGNFSKSISGLTPGTTYFYRAIALINETEIEGDIISFTTTTE
jgi:high-affinity Fe2+/Pb2+ permease